MCLYYMVLYCMESIKRRIGQKKLLVLTNSVQERKAQYIAIMIMIMMESLTLSFTDA